MLLHAADTVDVKKSRNGKPGLVMGALNKFNENILYPKTDTLGFQAYSISGFAHGYQDSSWLYLDDAGRLGIAVEASVVQYTTTTPK